MLASLTNITAMQAIDKKRICELLPKEEEEWKPHSSLSLLIFPWNGLKQTDLVAVLLPLS
jgi:hypothetical protein